MEEEKKTQSSGSGNGNGNMKKNVAAAMAVGSPVHSQVKKIIKQESEKKNIDWSPRGEAEMRSVLAREIFTRQQHSRSRLGLATQPIIVSDS